MVKFWNVKHSSPSGWDSYWQDGFTISWILAVFLASGNIPWSSWYKFSPYQRSYSQEVFFDESTFDYGRLLSSYSKEACVVDVSQESRLVGIFSSDPVFTNRDFIWLLYFPKWRFEKWAFPGESLHSHGSRILVVSLSGLWILTTVLWFVSIKYRFKLCDRNFIPQ